MQMRNVIIKSVTGWILLCLAVLLYSGAMADEIIPNRAIVKLQKGLSIEEVIVDFEGVAIDTIYSSNTFLVLFDGTEYSMETVLNGLRNKPGVIFTQPDYWFVLPEVNQISQSFPDEGCPVFIDGTDPASYYEQTATDMINADLAYVFSTGEGVVVAVIDNGLDFGHPLFENALAGPGYDFVDDDNDASEKPGLLYGHGTFVSGLIKRAAPGCLLIPLRAFDGDGLGNTFAVADALYRAIDNNVDAVNMSFSMYEDNPLFREAVSDAVKAGIILVSSTGNDGYDTMVYPSGYDGVIAVSAVDTLEVRADFSNYGAYVDVCAPGVNIYSSLAGDFQWGTWSGTSFAAPMATGVCALVLSLKPNLSTHQIEELIRESSRTELLWGTVVPPDPEYGYGCVDAFNTVLNISRGDVDYTRTLDISDITYLFRYIYRSGMPPEPVEAVGDLDCSGSMDISDIVMLIRHMYYGEPLPPCN